MSLYHPRDDMFHPAEFSKKDGDGKKAPVDLPDVDCRPGIIPVEFNVGSQTWTIPVHLPQRDYGDDGLEIPRFGWEGTIVIRVEPDLADESNELVVASLRP
jgi:hypothetical protein